MRVKVRPIGSSLGVILPKHELDARGIRAGDTIDIRKIVHARGRDLFGVWKDRPAKVRGSPE